MADLAFDNFANSFEGTRRDFLCRHPTRQGLGLPTAARRLLYSAAYRSARLLRTHNVPGIQLVELPDIWGDALDLSEPSFVAAVFKNRLVIADGWLFHDRVGLRKHKPTVRRYLRPVPPLAKRASFLSMRARGPGEILVGVHVRQGDYDKFLEGKYFYPFETYLGWMRQITKLTAKRVSFLVSSDEDVGHRFTEFENATVVSGDPVVDLYALARCDLLIGPPSTFSMWASYYGDVPLLMMTDPLDKIVLTDFRIVGSQMDFPDVAARHVPR